MTVPAETQRTYAPHSSVETAGSPGQFPHPAQSPVPAQSPRPVQSPESVKSRKADGAAAATAAPARRREPVQARLARSAQSAGQRFQEATGEPALSDFWGQVVAEAGAGTVPFLLRNPQRTLAAGIATLRLPARKARLGDGPAARIIRWTLDRHVLPGVPIGATGVGMLEIPERAEEYVVGSSKQTLRRKIRAAEKAGITFRPVDDPDERRSLVDRARQAEIAHPDETYRSASPNVDDLLDYDLWLLAVSRDGDPLLLSVTPTDGEWALLRYFRTFGQGDEYSNSRYLMSRALVEALSARGVRYLIDTFHPMRLPNGLRHFQRMVGFRIVRARVARPER
jgi:hypothetical protein